MAVFIEHSCSEQLNCRGIRSIRRCIEHTLAPETFALDHNGITLHASRMQPVDGGVRITLLFAGPSSCRSCLERRREAQNNVL
jgi:hypothetical protein